MSSAEFWSTTPGSVVAGETFSICINSPDDAGETITVGVFLSDGSPANPATVDVVLDNSGKGCKDYVAPTGTAFLTLTAEGEQDHNVTIT